MMRIGCVVVATLFVATSAEAQVGRGGDPQSRLLLEAATLESRGDLDGAEASLRRLVEIEPTSSGAIFALERVLRAKGEAAELRPIVVAFLARTSNASVMALNLGLLIEADSSAQMVVEAERWLSGNQSESAYREVARAYARVFGVSRALDVLRRGRSALGAREALALEMGDLLAENGQVDEAVDEWSIAVGDGARIDEVVTRVAGLEDGSERAGRRLVAALGDSDLAERRDAALTAALAFDLEAESIAMAGRRADNLDGRARQSYLEGVARRAREARLAGVAAWALRELGGGVANPEGRREFDRRTVEIALEAGDTTVALDAQRRLAASFQNGGDEARRARAEVVRLESAVAPERATASWRDFKGAFPEAPELDEVAAAVAVSLQARGDDQGAAAVLEGIDGPRSTLERGYLLLARGQIEEGRQALLRSVSLLPPVEAIEIIQFGSLLGRLTDEGKGALADAGVNAHRGRPEQGSRALAERMQSLPERDRAALLAQAGRFADEGGAGDFAADLRRTLIADFPDAPEVAEASLALARHMGREGGDEMGAIRLLEELIISRPNSAVVPEARLELERLRSRGS